MGSSITTVGNKGGKVLATFTAANQDTGVMLSAFPSDDYPPGDLPTGYKTVLFQLLPGDMSAGSITVYGTIDIPTAADLVDEGGGAAWEPVVSPSTEASFAWSNPLTQVVGQRLLKVDAPFLAYRAVASGDFVGSGAVLQVLAAP